MYKSLSIVLALCMLVCSSWVGAKQSDLYANHTAALYYYVEVFGITKFIDRTPPGQNLNEDITWEYSTSEGTITYVLSRTYDQNTCSYSLGVEIVKPGKETYAEIIDVRNVPQELTVGEVANILATKLFYSYHAFLTNKTRKGGGKNELTRFEA